MALALHNPSLDSALQASLDDLRQANDELQASRARIVASADASAQIERNLHDGAQQHLVALAVKLRLARDSSPSADPRRCRAARRARPRVQDAIQQLRDLAHGIYPPLLMDTGWPRRCGPRRPRSPLAVTASADGPRAAIPQRGRGGRLLLLPRGAAERRQARPRRARHDHAARPAGELLFEVADDGPGFDPATTAGAARACRT